MSKCAECETVSTSGRDMSCSGCRTVTYCDNKCQKSHWARMHKWECARLIFPRGTPPVKFKWGNAADTYELLTGEKIVGDPRRTPTTRPIVGRLPQTVPVDCSLFMQLVAALAAGRPGSIGIGYSANGCVTSSCKRDGDQSVLALNGEDLVVSYLTGSTASVLGGLVHAGDYSGQWLAGPDKRDRYLGMSKDGPVRQPLDWWENCLNEGLSAEREKCTRRATARGDDAPVMRARAGVLTSVIGIIGRDGWKLWPA
jgi:hypothetical protein